MHFFYLDESGDTGKDLDNQDQPIMVLGGISLRDEAWNKTHEEMQNIISGYFGGVIPSGFELHANQLLATNPAGHFAGHDIARRSKLALDLLDLLGERKHGSHYIAFKKSDVKEIDCGVSLEFNPSRPYLLGFDYMVTLINWYVKNKLGSTARGLIVLDEKRNSYQDNIERMTFERRFGGAKSHRVKWIAEISYAVDSKRNSMIQLSDLVVFCVRRFLEIDHGFREEWPDEAKNFYARAYLRIDDRLIRKTIIDRPGQQLKRLNEYIGEVHCLPAVRWKSKYDITV
jgi:hypothetical protein